MCGGDDHLAWKHPVSSETCRGLRTAGGYDRFCQGSFKVHPYPFRATMTLQVEPQILRLGLPLYTWVHLRAFRASMVTVRIQHSPFFSLQLRVLGDRYEFEYDWITFSSCRLSLCFALDEFNMFSPQGFHSHFLARHTPSLCCHLLDTLGHVHDHLFTLSTYHGLSTSFFV